MGEPTRRGGAKRLSELLTTVLRSSIPKGELSQEMLEAAWRRVVGEVACQETRVDGYQDGVLRVEVTSAPLLSELATFRRNEILQALRADPTLAMHEVRDIRFRLNAAAGGRKRRRGEER